MTETEYCQLTNYQRLRDAQTILGTLLPHAELHAEVRAEIFRKLGWLIEEYRQVLPETPRP